MSTFKPAYRLTLFAPRSVDPAEATILTPVAGAAHSDPFKVTTLPSLAGWKPYLQPPAGRSGRIDALNKRTDSGVMVFRILDPQVGATKLTRWLAAFTGDLKGRLRFGNLLGFAEQSLDGGSTWTAFWTGRVRQLHDAVVAVDIYIRELADDLQAFAFVGRPHASITYAGFPTLLPVMACPIAYGTGPSALPIVKPLTGTVTAFPGVASTVRNVALDAASRSRPDNVITMNLRQNLQGDWQVPRPAFPGRLHLKRLDTLAVGYFNASWDQQANTKGHFLVPNLGISELGPTEVGYLALPPVSTAVEVWVEAEFYATADTPLFIGDIHPVTLWKHILEGKFGYLYTPPETLPPGKAYGDPKVTIPYDTAKFATLEADTTFPLVRFIVTKREQRGTWITKNLLPAAHLAYYLNGAGQIVPIDLRIPSDVSAVPTITDADLLALPTWDYDRSVAITRADATYYEDVLTQGKDIAADTATWPQIRSGGLTEVKHPVTLIDLGNADLGDQPFAIDIAGFRMMTGEQLQGRGRGAYLLEQLVRLAMETARPFGFGAPALVLYCVRGGNGDAFPGDLRKVACNAVLDPQTNVRGGTRLIRVTGREEKGPGVQIRGDDLGSPTVAAVPTLAQPAQETGNTANGVTSAVTLNAAGDPVQVRYAVTATSVGTVPVDTSPLWTPSPAGIVKSTSTTAVHPVPAGSRVWVQGRSFPAGGTGTSVNLPSAWVLAAGTGRVDTAAIAAPSAPASANVLARSFRVTWTLGVTDLPLEMLLATPTSDPRVVVARLPAGSVRYDFPGGTGVDILPSTTYRVGIRHYQDSPASVSAEVTVDVATGAAAIIIPPPVPRPLFPPQLIPL